VLWRHSRHGRVAPGARRLDRAARELRSAAESVPINNLVQVEGTPLHGTDPLDPLEFVRAIAVARITMPRSYVRLSAGRQQMSEAIQALCFLAGANSIFYGDKLLTTGNPDVERDRALMHKLGVRALTAGCPAQA
jgi:biotin synthase